MAMRKNVKYRQWQRMRRNIDKIDNYINRPLDKQRKMRNNY